MSRHRLARKKLSTCWREQFGSLGNGVPKIVDGACRCLFEEGFEFGECHFDRIEVWAVGRQEPKLGAGALDRLSDGNRFVSGQIVHDDDVARRERRRQDLFDISEESGVVHSAVKDHGRCHALQPERADKGRGFPVTVRHRGSAAFATQSPSISPGHFGRCTRFIDEYQPFHLKIELGIRPGLPLTQDVRPLLFGGVRSFFLNVMPWRSSRRQIVLGATFRP